MLGDAVGGAFIKEYFKGTQLNMEKTLSQEITKLFSQTLKKWDSMDSYTKGSAQSKLSAIDWKVGYSSTLDKYDDVKIQCDSLSDNIFVCIMHDSRTSIARLGQPDDETKWFMSSDEVNAYYSPVQNEMVFPFGILQPPFSSNAYPDAINYGSIRAVVGHEMSHGFDSSAIKYDKDG